MGSVKLGLADAILLALVAVACGGGQSGAASPDDAEQNGENSDRRSGRSEEPGGSEQGEEQSQASCEDGSCFRCGEGICPKGFYCDKNAKGGPACGWLPACAEEPSCSCLKQSLGASCNCDEEGGGLSVDCE